VLPPDAVEPPAPLLLLPAVPLDTEPPVPAGLPVVVDDDMSPVPVETFEEPPEPDPVLTLRLEEVPELSEPPRGGLLTGSPAEEQATANIPSEKKTNFDPSKSR
jgi:hypothetical protein